MSKAERQENYGPQYNLNLLRENYLRRRENDIVLLSEAIVRQDFGFIRKTAHQIIGNASMYGFQELGALAKKLSYFASIEEVLELQKVVIEMHDFVESAQA